MTPDEIYAMCRTQNIDDDLKIVHRYGPQVASWVSSGIAIRVRVGCVP